MAPNEVEKAYMAGIIDGEGYIGIRGRTKRSGYWARMSVTMVELDAVTMLHRFYGGSLGLQKSKNPNARVGHVWTVASKKMSRVLNELLPYLKVKKRQAEIVLEFQVDTAKNKHFAGRGHLGFKKLDSKTIEYREDLYKLVKSLNKVGV